MLLSVGVHERDVRAPAAPARRGKQRHRHIDTYDAAGRSDGIGELQGRLPAAAADVEDVLTPARGKRAEGGAAERIELTIESLLLGDPRLGGTSIPVLNLRGVHHRRIPCAALGISALS